MGPNNGRGNAAPWAASCHPKRSVVSAPVDGEQCDASCVKDAVVLRSGMAEIQSKRESGSLCSTIKEEGCYAFLGGQIMDLYFY